MTKRKLLLIAIVAILFACSVPTFAGAPTFTKIPEPKENLPTFTPFQPTETHMIMCTPPACTENESYYCPGDCPGGCGTVCATHTPSASLKWWQPEPGLRFHIQYSGEIDLNQQVDVYNLDLFETSAETIDQLHQRDIRVICYFSAGSFEDWRPDADKFPVEILGKSLDDWPGETWLDIRQLESLAPIMLARLELAAQKGCDAVDPDNVDGYTNSTGFDLNADDQLSYNRWLADQAHALGLAIGLKNDLDQVPALAATFDFAVNEECYTYDECEILDQFIQQNKPVFGIEYQADPAKICPMANESRFSFTIKNLELDAEQIPCWKY